MSLTQRQNTIRIISFQLLSTVVQASSYLRGNTGNGESMTNKEESK
jgi:hypothetical protein